MPRTIPPESQGVDQAPRFGPSLETMTQPFARIVRFVRSLHLPFMWRRHHDAPAHPDKDELLRDLLEVLARRGIAERWSQSRTPYSDLRAECSRVASDEAARQQFATYLHQNPVIQLTVESLIEYMAAATLGGPQDADKGLRNLADRGARLTAWLPTFLIIDGPLGHFLRDPDSPLNALLREQHATYPILAQARDLFNHDLFRRVRNAFAHWSFFLRPGDDRVICLNWDTGQTSVEITPIEAEALHLASVKGI